MRARHELDVGAEAFSPVFSFYDVLSYENVEMRDSASVSVCSPQSVIAVLRLFLRSMEAGSFEIVKL